MSDSGRNGFRMRQSSSINNGDDRSVARGGRVVSSGADLYDYLGATNLAQLYLFIVFIEIENFN